MKPIKRILYRVFPIIDLENRTGSCKMCGQCCKGCYLLDKNICKQYNDRPWFCIKDFPRSQQELDLKEIKNCGYKFK